jgi:nicotinate-nucleotide--dimethylbenzimidazole phosphoribosyltransferase
MVLNFITGGAAINVFCLQNHIRLKVVDAGVNHDFARGPAEDFINAKIGWGTRNYMEQPAMTEEQAGKAIEKGKEIVKDIQAKNCNCIGFGEMGIGNTSAATLIMSAITGFGVEECTGRGTGCNEEQLEIKIRTLQKVYDFHHLIQLKNQPLRLLNKVGGFEIAMMVGAFLKAAELKMVIVVDGFIAGSALLIARAIDERVLENCIFAHTSGEKGHEKMLTHLGVRPLLNLGMRLGEGTGAALAIPLIQSAVNFLEEMASFESAGITKKM